MTAIVEKTKGSDLSTPNKKKRLDLKGDGLALYRYIRPISEAHRKQYEPEWEMMYRMYKSVIEVVDPGVPNPFVPLTFIAIETACPRIIKALLGETPYFPMRARNLAAKGQVEALSKMVDYFVDRNGLFPKMSGMLKGVNLWGTMVGKTYWDMRVKQKKVMKSKKNKGFIVGQSETWEPMLEESLNWEFWTPWHVGVDPDECDIDKMRWIYLEKRMSASALADHMGWAEYDNNRPELLVSKSFDDFSVDVRRKLGYSDASLDDDGGVLTEVYCPNTGRYLEIWNGQAVLRDHSNYSDFNYVPLVRFANSEDPHPNSFFAQTSTKPAAMLNMMVNDALASLYTNFQRINEPTIYYEHGAIDPNLIGQGLVPINSEKLLGKDIASVIQTVQPGIIDQSVYQILDILQKMHDQTYGQSAYMQGNIPERKETAYGIRTVKEAGEERLDNQVKNIEIGAMARMGLHNLFCIAENADAELITDVLGDLAKYIVATDGEIMNRPDQVLGGFDFEFRGSDIISEQDTKFQRKMMKYEKLSGVLGEAAAKVWALSLLKTDDDMTEEEYKEVAAASQQPPPQPTGMAGAGIGAMPPAPNTGTAPPTPPSGDAALPNPGDTMAPLGGLPAPLGSQLPMGTQAPVTGE
jgi:hypothetical protein